MTGTLRWVGEKIRNYFHANQCNGRRFKTTSRIDVDVVKDRQNAVATGKLYKCHICGKETKYSGSLKVHILLHNNEKQTLNCDQCEKDFTGFEYLRKHIRRHIITAFKCSICEKALPQRRNLQEHMRIHTGDKPHSCGNCGRLFRTERVLTVHIWLHIGLKPYSCKIVTNHFDMQEDWAETCALTGQRKKTRYTWESCGKASDDQSNLISH